MLENKLLWVDALLVLLSGLSLPVWAIVSHERVISLSWYLLGGILLVHTLNTQICRIHGTSETPYSRYSAG